MSVIAIPKILREKLSDDGANALVELLDKVNVKSEEVILDRATDKFEKRLSEVKAEIIKWMFIFIFGQFWAIVGVLFAFFRK
ncbi:MAG: hypothetical protein WC947_03375 [Elusimicrobiota bacterium]